MKQQRGFTLMEMIAVMAIIAILSAVIAPSVVDLIDDTFAKAEVGNLDRLADDLELYIRRNGQIPSATDWAAALGTITSASPSQIANNQRGYQRLFYADPAFFGGSSFGGYTQTTGLTARPASPRIMIVSDLRANVANQGNNATRFNDIWNENSGATLVESDTLVIRRINLQSLFQEVLLTNGSSNQAAVSFDGTTQVPIPASAGGADGVLQRFVIADSRVSVFSDPYPIGALQRVFKLNGDLGLRYGSADGGDDDTNPVWVQP